MKIFKYMYDYNLKRNYTLPRSISPNIKIQLDDYIENTIIRK